MCRKWGSCCLPEAPCHQFSILSSARPSLHSPQSHLHCFQLEPFPLRLWVCPHFFPLPTLEHTGQPSVVIWVFKSAALLSLGLQDYTPHWLLTLHFAPPRPRLTHRGRGSLLRGPSLRPNPSHALRRKCLSPVQPASLLPLHLWGIGPICGPFILVTGLSAEVK